jgi:hypothetical protein
MQQPTLPPNREAFVPVEELIDRRLGSARPTPYTHLNERIRRFAADAVRDWMPAADPSIVHAFCRMISLYAREVGKCRTEQEALDQWPRTEREIAAWAGAIQDGAWSPDWSVPSLREGAA